MINKISTALKHREKETSNLSNKVNNYLDLNINTISSLFKTKEFDTHQPEQIHSPSNEKNSTQFSKNFYNSIHKTIMTRRREQKQDRVRSINYEKLSNSYRIFNIDFRQTVHHEVKKQREK